LAAPRRLEELAALAGATIVGDAGVAIERVSAVDDATAGSLTFAVDGTWLKKALRSAATAVIVPAPEAEKIADRGGKSLLIAQDVRAALASILAAFAADLPKGEFTHPAASVETDVVRGAGVWIGAGAIVCAGAMLGDGVILMPGSFVGRAAKIGKRTLLHPRSVVLDGCVVGDDCILNAGCVIGSDGFGFVRIGEEQIKIPQIGNVVIGDRVEIGACATIDRAVTGATVVGSGTKIDNLVQIGHNVQIGENCVLCGQAGIAGSTKIGRGTIAAGQVGVSGHLEVGEYSILLARSGVFHSLPPHSHVFGTPAVPHREQIVQQVLVRKLPKLNKDVRALTDAVAELRKRQ
jgi:UDP-3-O-[3-hydroxymyristoyl] glucosamine N-acyltransferase